MDSANPVTGQQARRTVPSARRCVAWHLHASCRTSRGPPRTPRDLIWFRQTVLRLLRDPLSRDCGRQASSRPSGCCSRSPALCSSWSPSPSASGCRSVSLACWSGCRCWCCPCWVPGGSARSTVGWPLAAGTAGRAAASLRPQPGALAGPGRLTDPVGWRACAYLLLKLPLSVLGVIIMIYLLFFGLPYLTFPIWWEILHVNDVVIHVPGWLVWWKPNPLLVANSVHSLAVSFALVPVGVAVLLYCPWWLRQCNAVDGGWSPGCSGRRRGTGCVSWSRPGPARWTTRPRGCAGSSGTCTTGRRPRWSPSP